MMFLKIKLKKSYKLKYNHAKKPLSKSTDCSYMVLFMVPKSFHGGYYSINRSFRTHILV